MNEPSPSPSTKNDDALAARLEHLPPQLKLKLMGLVSPNLSVDNAAVYESSASEMLPRVDMRSLIAHPENLSLWTEKQLLELDDPGYIIVDNFMGAGHAEKVRADGQKLLQFGALRPAQMAAGKDQWKADAIRGDKILWLNQRETYEAMATATFAVIDKMRAMRDELNRIGPFASDHTQVQFACYDGEGARCTTRKHQSHLPFDSFSS